MARRLRETDEICKQLNAAYELTADIYKSANAASEQAGWSCPPKVGRRAKRRGYVTEAKKQVKKESGHPERSARCAKRRHEETED